MTRAELMRRSPAPPVRSLVDLPETERVWTEHVHFGAAAHQRAAHRTAVCGVRLLEWPVSAGHLAVLSGELCRDGCWPGGEDR